MTMQPVLPAGYGRPPYPVPPPALDPNHPMVQLFGAAAGQSSSYAVVAAHAQVIAQVEMEEHRRPYTIRNLGSATPGTVVASGGTITCVPLTLKAGFRFTGITCTLQDSQNWMVLSLNANALQIISPSDPPANLASFQGNRELTQRIAAYTLRDSTQDITFQAVVLCIAPGGATFSGFNIEGRDLNQACALDGMTAPSPVVQGGFRFLGPRLSGVITNILGMGPPPGSQEPPIQGSWGRGIQ